jgi:hypothetical protein
MKQVTEVKLQELTILQLYEHYGALERSLPLLTSESQEVAKAELEACLELRSEKIDGVESYSDGQASSRIPTAAAQIADQLATAMRTTQRQQDCGPELPVHTI